ncbi:sensor domain-containing diguanylate cyclase [Aestuariibacter sp. A3R04]|uniref:GGDEF domain-containing protein n=1 Tax=Aestuariibacter sp. A3R04 TaxID=2841571 RepID=UPI001C09C265|nr:sensor domain-containing diguanylate cyclase [Aestuariibacter sp. A3R04]MBU3021161.1 sensor domain-containing diguanylate cyclase [Aestuariibacter sp. A3R04]
MKKDLSLFEMPVYPHASLARMINFINEAVLVFSPAGHIEMINVLASTLLGGSRVELLGDDIAEFFYHANDSLKQQLVAHATSDKESATAISVQPREVALRRKDGGKVLVDLSISPIEVQEGPEDILYFCVLHDLTIHKAEHNELHRKATTDQLTGLANRHYFTEELQRLWQLSIRESVPLSLVLIDVDHFKHVNDTFGHVAGDKCLKRIGETIQLSLPHRDAIAARYGGEEFALILPHCNTHTAHLLAMRIQRHIAQLRFQELTLQIEPLITVSAGVVTQKGNVYKSASSLIEAADSLLYKAKEAGRNQICL